MPEKNQKPAGDAVPFKTYSDPAAHRLANGETVAPSCKVYEPHDYNRLVLQRQRAKGEAANVPMVPGLGKTHTVSIKKPAQRDLIKEAERIVAAKRAMIDAESANQDVLPGDGVDFDALG